MKKLIKLSLVLFVLALFVTACGTRQSGQLIGVQKRPSWKGINPFGMVYVPSGTLHIGPSDQDVSRTYVQRPKSISIQGFYMDDTEITNNEYRQFTQWVKEFVAHDYLDHYEEDEYGEQYMLWDEYVDWESEELRDEFYYQGDERINNKMDFDVSKLVFKYQWYDWQAAAHAAEGTSRTAFIKEDELAIYPDTLCWVRDFAYSYNEPMTRNYYWHPAFDDYPVVGVDWKMATAFCYWRTQLWRDWEDPELGTEDFRLPTEFEWEYAARGGNELAPYPWGAYYTRNAKGCLLANFKPGRGNYPEDGGFHTVKGDAYFPNDYGLYNMAGNVAEWTSTAFDENAYAFIHDLNPDLRYDALEDDPLAQKRKTIRGGSWKDVSFYIQTGTRHWEYQESKKSYIGFRGAITFLGRSINDF